MKTQLSKPARERASYTDQYKQEALELWRASGRSAAKVAAELGIRPPLALPLGALGAHSNAFESERKVEAQRRRTGSGDPAFTGGERQALGAA